MYTLHIGNKNYSSWSLRPWVLMRDLDIPFTEELHRFGPGSNHDAFRAFSPTGRVPCLHDGLVVVWDSLAIVEYLAERHSGVWPRDPRARAFARCAAAEMHTGFGELRNRCGMNCGLRIQLHEMTPGLQQDLTRLSELWHEGIKRFGGPFLAGSHFTAADAFFCPVAFRIQTYAPALDPGAIAYARRLLSLPAMQAWYDAALAETFRDFAHEAEVRQYGSVTEDLRVPATV